jgi:hypothetical protein
MVALLCVYRGKTATERWQIGGEMVQKRWGFGVFLVILW